MRWLRAFSQSPDGVLWNVTLNTGTGGATCATDTIAGVDHQLVKVEFGAAGAATQVSPTAGLPVRSTGATSASANVAENASSVALLASNANRLGWSIYNDSDAALNINFTSAASASAFVFRVLPRGFVSARDFGPTVFTGAINGIWDSTPGTSGHASARTMELTA